MFLQSFANRSVRALVIEPQTQTRAMMVEVLRELGLSARASADMKTGVALLESERYDWILMPPCLDSQLSIIQLLGHTIRNPKLRKISVSLILPDDKDFATPPKAMELGCLSWHLGPFTKETFANEMKSLMDCMFQNGFMTDLVSASYVRKLAEKLPVQDQVVAMESTLVRLHPGNFKVLMEAADSCKKLEAYQDALLLLSQARLMETAKNSTAAVAIEEIKKIMSEKNIELERPLTSKDIIGIECIAIVDPDSTVQQFVEKSMKDIGVAEIHVFSNGQAFMDWFSDKEPDVVLLEWKIVGLSAAKILQRSAARTDKSPPHFVVASSSLGQNDMPLLKELGVSSVIAKPFGKVELLSSLLKAHAGNSQMAGVHYEHRIRALLRAKKYSPAMKLAKDFFASKSVNPARKMLVQADFHIGSKKYEKAKDLCLKAMAMPHDNLYALQLLGKCFMGLRQFDYAMKCFDKAQALSPMNVERLCLMAVAEAEQGNNDAAAQWMESAKKSDAKNNLVLETATTVALVQDDMAAAKKAAKELPNIMGVVAFQNNRAVALAKANRLPESIEIYVKTLQILPENAKEANEIVKWNLALAYVKANDLVKAEEILSNFSNSNKSRVGAKIESLGKKISTAKSSGQPVSLNTDDSISMSDSNNKSEKSADESLTDQDLSMLMYVDVKPGEMGCFQLFSESSKSDELEKLVNNLPPLKLRWT